MKKIKKAKLTSVAYLDVEFEQTIIEGDERFTLEVAQKCTWTPHNDLLLVFDELKPHLAYLCEQTEVELYIDGKRAPAAQMELDFKEESPI